MRKISIIGFTLIEVLIVLSIILILTFFTVTSFRHLFNSSEYQAASQRLMRVLALTRTEAITSGHAVVLCHSGDGQTCNGDWSQGYIIQSDQHILYQFSNKNENHILYWRAFPSMMTFLEFLPNGMPNFQNGTFWYCPLKKKYPVWAIFLSQSGRARLVLPDQKGKIMDDKDNLLQCSA